MVSLAAPYAVPSSPAAPLQTVRSIGNVDSVTIYGTRWWENADPRTIAHRQVHIREAICPVMVFCSAISAFLDRPVTYYEIARRRSALIAEVDAKVAATAS